MNRLRDSITLLLGCSTLLLAACRPNIRHADANATEVAFSVAASAQQPMEVLAGRFKAQHGVTVTINSGPSNGLASQIISGAPVDLFLSANEQWAQQVKAAGLSVAERKLLTNKLVLIVAADNEAEIAAPQDLLSASVHKVVLGGEQVPAGIYATQALEQLGLFEGLARAGKIARAQDVRRALHFVERHEAEAGIVYASDALGNTAVRIVHEFDPKLHDEIAYLLLLVNQPSLKPEARAFFEFLQQPAATEVYERFGFAAAPR